MFARSMNEIIATRNQIQPANTETDELPMQIFGNAATDSTCHSLPLKLGRNNVNHRRRRHVIDINAKRNQTNHLNQNNPSAM